MIELDNDQLRFSFPDVDRQAVFAVDFQRTLRIPDDDRSYPLPPGLGRFPVRHVDDFAERLPADWKRRGGVMLPMYQAEALWLCFDSAEIAARHCSYPFAVKIGAGKINAVNGQPWTGGLDVTPQGYVVVPQQPWLDGFAVEEGVVRQFVAMPLGSGYSAEEQLTGEAEWGGIQLEVFPMRRAAFDRRFPERRDVMDRHSVADLYLSSACYIGSAAEKPSMALAPGGRMKQQIMRDRFDSSEWDLDSGQRCFLHLANSVLWRQITGAAPPQPPVTAAEYKRAGLPWFDWYSEQPAVKGGKRLAWLDSVSQLGKKKRDQPLPENQSVATPDVVPLGPNPRPGNRVRVGEW